MSKVDLMNNILVKYVNKNDNKHSFVSTDVIDALDKLYPLEDIPVIEIEYGYKNISHWKDDIKNAISSIAEDRVAIICKSIITYEDYPKSEYYDPNIMPPVQGKKEIPIKEALEKEDAIFKELGFININGYVKYIYSNAYIWNNEIGSEIAELFSNTTR